MKLFKKICFLTFTISFLTACGGSEPADATSSETEKISTETSSSEIETPTVTKEELVANEPESESEVPPRDLGGLVVRMGSWSTTSEPEEKANAQEKALWEYRNEMMEKHNFSVESISVGKWNTTLEAMSTSTMAGDPSAEVFQVFSRYVPTAISNGLCYDLATLEELDFSEPKWDNIVKEVTKRGDSIYGMATTQSPALGLFFNKRLFQEAGLDPDLLYDLQASGEWTWAKMEELLPLLTRDVDNDGIFDVHAINFNMSNAMKIILLSNNARLVDMDENGKFINTITTLQALEAFNWINKVSDLPYDVIPHWDDFNDFFINAKVAMFPAHKEKVSDFLEMEDDYGFVAFPKGPQGEYSFSSKASCWLIPSSFSPEKAADIAFVMDIWTDEAPGYDGEDDWMMSEYKYFRDKRAVEETLVMARQPGVMKYDYKSSMSGINTNTIIHPIIYNSMTVMKAIKAARSQYDADIAKANREQSSIFKKLSHLNPFR